ncbi:VWA domain-containing protein [Flammeovirga aprica]|uniref:VWA domain-containing protein n=1 Tax=Flammeovirga aprica TaxID=29528 RepID=UPI00197D7139|nr:von Willebrand factor type A domain-containing protein [Flammeovirga aprica]
MNFKLFSTLFSLPFLIFSCGVNEDVNAPDIGIYDDSFYEELPETLRENYKDHGENPFIDVVEQPLSTFSIDADGASYANMRRFMYFGRKPPVASVRIEEYLNYFTYDYA